MKLDKYLDDLIYEKPAGPAAVSQLERLYTTIRDRTFLRDMGMETLKEHIGSPGTVNRNLLEQYGNLRELGAFANLFEDFVEPPETKSLAFYEPGDVMHDTKFHIMNDYLPLLLLGVYRIPVPFEIRQAVFDASRPVFLPNTTINTADRENINNSRPIQRATPENHQIFDVEDNIIRRQMFPEAGPPVPYLQLSEVIDFTNRTINNGKKHFFMVKACRTTRDSATSRLARRFSIAARANRERIGVNAATLAARPASRYRSALNRAFLERIAAALPGRLPKLAGEKRVLEAELASKKGIAFAKQYEIDSQIANIDREIASVNEGITILTRILTRPVPFTMTDIRTALRPAKGGLQKEFVELLEL